LTTGMQPQPHGETVKALMDAAAPVEVYTALSVRELEILSMVATGLSNKHTANALSLKSETVKWHMKNIFRKLGVSSRVEAIQKARRNRLIS